MKRNFKILFSITVIFLLHGSLYSDGKLLRGEKWHRFNVEGKKADFYVSPKGNDKWSGTLPEANQNKTDGPFATLARAKKAVRALKKKIYKNKEKPIDKRFIPSPYKFGSGKDILVLLRGGYYQLDETLILTFEDGEERVETGLPSGAFEFHKLKDHYVTYAAYPGEKPVLLGGKLIKKWNKNNKVWTTHLNLNSVNKLYANGRFQTLARTPNKGYFTVAEPSASAEYFKYNNDDLKNWPGIDKSRIIMLLRWHTGINSIVKVDEKSKTAYLAKPQKGILVVSPRYYVENIKALLDNPGEWYFDEKKKELFFMPPESLSKSSDLAIVAPILSKIIDIKGTRTNPVRNLRFYGLHIAAVDDGGEAIAMEYARDCEVVDCDIRAVGGKGIKIKRGCYQTRILGNKIKYAVKGGIDIRGVNYPKFLSNDSNTQYVNSNINYEKEPCKHTWVDLLMKTTVSYNQIDSCGGTSLNAANCLFITISHNEVSHNLGRYSIYVGGWNNIEESVDAGYAVEYNHVHHAQTKADDSGAITTAGMTTNSYVRYNLIHDVQKGFFNNNVAFWFDNMSSGWVTEKNIYYNLQQGEMKLCACNLLDNEYRDNYWIKAPKNAPENIIDGLPHFELSAMKIENLSSNNTHGFTTGDQIKISVEVFNSGASGLGNIDCYVDGKIVQRLEFPVIHNNKRVASFTQRFSRPGEHAVAFGGLPYMRINVGGKKSKIFVDSLYMSSSILPLGERLKVQAVIINNENRDRDIKVPLLLNDKKIMEKQIFLGGRSQKRVEFILKPNAGEYRLAVGNSGQRNLTVYKHHPLEISKIQFAEYCAPRAKPCKLTYDKKKNYFKIRTAGTDFFHGEDAYSTIYIKKPIKGNFTAIVKIKRFGPNTTEWFRTGLFVRNDITQSYDNGKGSLGSVLLFSTP